MYDLWFRILFGAKSLFCKTVLTLGRKVIWRITNPSGKLPMEWEMDRGALLCCPKFPCNKVNTWGSEQLKPAFTCHGNVISGISSLWGTMHPHSPSVSRATVTFDQRGGGSQGLRLKRVAVVVVLILVTSSSSSSAS